MVSAALEVCEAAGAGRHTAGCVTHRCCLEAAARCSLRICTRLDCDRSLTRSRCRLCATTSSQHAQQQQAQEATSRCMKKWRGAAPCNCCGRASRSGCLGSSGSAGAGAIFNCANHPSLGDAGVLRQPVPRPPLRGDRGRRCSSSHITMPSALMITQPPGRTARNTVKFSPGVALAILALLWSKGDRCGLVCLLGHRSSPLPAPRAPARRLPVKGSHRPATLPTHTPAAGTATHPRSPQAKQTTCGTPSQERATLSKPQLPPW